MKIKITEIEATPEDLKASNNIAEKLLGFIRSVLPDGYSESEDPEEEEECGVQ